MSVPALVERAAQASAGDHSGFVSFRVEQTSHVDGGPIHRSIDVVIVAAYENDRPIRIRVLKYVDNGKEAAEPARLELESRLARSGEGFAVPFDARHFAEYAYDPVDDRTVRFTSGLHDSRHGEGSFTVAAGAHVSELRYRPFVLPEHATSGVIEESRAEVLPGFWATTRSVQRYTGRYLLIRGSAEVTTMESQFARYSSRAQAEAAVRTASL